LLGLRRDRFLRIGIIESNTDGRYSDRGTGIAPSISGACDNATSCDATTINNPTSSSSSTSTSASGFCHDPISGCASTVNNPTSHSRSAATCDFSFTSAFTCPCTTRTLCFSTFRDDSCARFSRSIALSKKTVASYASSARYANATTLNSDDATPFRPRSGSALRAGCRPGTSPGNSPFFAGKRGSISYGFRRCLQF
jgi:hypothetical protein